MPEEILDDLGRRVDAHVEAHQLQHQHPVRAQVMPHESGSGNKK